MVTITDYKTNVSKEGKTFYSLEVQGGVEVVKSKETGRSYLTAKKAIMSCTFSEAMCKSLIGEKMPGEIIKKVVDAYEYKVPGTGEVILLTHSYEYADETAAIIDTHIQEVSTVI